MHQDKFNNPIFDDSELFDLLYQGKASCFEQLTVVPSADISQFEENTGITFQKFNPALETIDVSEYDTALQSDWFMPANYKTVDIKAWVISQCTDQTNLPRVMDELAAFEERNMLNLLRWLKYFVDTCNKENVLWGIGRGSSVASYVLYLIGVHNVDSVKYNLDWQEFLR